MDPKLGKGPEGSCDRLPFRSSAHWCRQPIPGFGVVAQNRALSPSIGGLAPHSAADSRKGPSSTDVPQYTSMLLHIPPIHSYRKWTISGYTTSHYYTPLEIHLCLPNSTIQIQIAQELIHCSSWSAAYHARAGKQLKSHVDQGCTHTSSTSNRL